MKSLRPWATPLTIATTLVTLVTGVLLFFHFGPGLSRSAHEWIGMLMVAAVLAHLALNWRAFKTYFKRPLGLGLIVAGGVAMALTLVISPAQSGNGGSPVGLILQSLNGAEIQVLAELAHKEVTRVIADLDASGLTATPDMTVTELTHGDRGQEMAILRTILSE